MGERMASFLNAISRHALALTIVALATTIGQVATLAQPALVSFGYDTPTYTQVAERIANTPLQFIDALRTPGYPFFLAVVFKLTGGVSYAEALQCYSDNAPRCDQIFMPVILAQVVLMIFIILECYLLVYWLTRHRWIATVVSSSITLNLYFLSWERMALSETLSAWSIVTLFVCFDRLVRRPTWNKSTTFALLAVACILIRPSSIAIPLVLLAALLARLLWTRAPRLAWTQAAATIAIIGVSLLGYCAWNGAANGVFGLSWVANVNLFGKILEYHMQDAPVPAKYQNLQVEANAYAANGAYEPYTFARQYGINYDQTHAVEVGEYAKYIVLHHPMTFALHTIPDLYKVWLAPGYLYPDYGVDIFNGAKPITDASAVSGITGFDTRLGLIPASSEPRWIDALLVISTLEQASYVTLPLLALIALALLWSRPQSIEGFELLVIALMVMGTIVLSATADYVEPERLRFPADWGMFILEGVVVLQAVAFLSRRREASDITQATTVVESASTSERSADALSAGPTPEMVTGRTMNLYDESLAVTVPRFRVYSADAQSTAQDSAIAHLQMSVVIPAYNERQTLINVVARVLRQPNVAEVIIVDDCSTDGTRLLMQQTNWPPEVRLFYHEHNMGKGAGIRTGIQAASKDVVIIQDADLEYDPSDFALLLKPITEGKADVVYGSRFLGKSAGFSRLHLVGNKLLTWLTVLLYRNGVTDMETCYKLFRTSIIKQIEIKSNRFDFEPEITAKISRLGYHIYEVPISYNGRDSNEGKKITWRDGFHAVWALVRFRFIN